MTHTHELIAAKISMKARKEKQRKEKNDEMFSFRKLLFCFHTADENKCILLFSSRDLAFVHIMHVMNSGQEHNTLLIMQAQSAAGGFHLPFY